MARYRIRLYGRSPVHNAIPSFGYLSLILLFARTVGHNNAVGKK